MFLNVRGKETVDRYKTAEMFNHKIRSLLKKKQIKNIVNLLDYTSIKMHNEESSEALQSYKRFKIKFNEAFVTSLCSVLLVLVNRV